MTQKFNIKSCWIITEGLIGTENQCIGVAEALGIRANIKRIALREPWKSISPYLGLEQWWSFDPFLMPPWPDLLITSGRKAIAPSRYIKKQSGGRTFTLHIQDPRIPPDNFDLLAVPEHDQLRGQNVIVTKAAPNRITPTRLATEAQKFYHLKKLTSPRVAVLIGGNSKTHRMTDIVVKNLIAQLQSLEGALMITISRRTPEKYAKLLRESLTGDHIYFWDGQGDNPYFAFLHYADFILATNDSASMLSEAATTGKPVYSIPLQGSSEKFTKLYKTLGKHGALRLFDGKLENYSYTPLQDAQMVADTLKKYFLQHEKQFNTG